MADKDTSNEDELDTSVDEVETPDESQEVDENIDSGEEDAENDTESEDDEEESEDDSEDDDESEDDEDDEEEESEFKKAFSNIKGDTPDEYIPNLEEAYRKSSAEGKKNAAKANDLQGRIDQINAAVAKNPELAKVIMEATGEKAVAPTVDPATQLVRQEYEAKVDKALVSFMSEHSAIEEDDEVSKEFFENVAIVGEAERKKGKVADPATAFKRAWAMMDVDESQDKLIDAAKKTASKTKSASSKKSTKKPASNAKLTSEQIAYAKKFGLTEKDLLDTLKNAQ